MPEVTPDKVCEICRAKVAELRRGRCWGCYAKWVEARPVGLGASCCICNDRRREHLKQAELLGAWLPICHNCAARATALSPMPRTLDEVRRRLRRDRRAIDRRVGRQDSRVFPRERRGLERRAIGLARGDDLMILDESDILVIEDLAAAESDAVPDETRIIERIASDAPARPATRSDR